MQLSYSRSRKDYSSAGRRYIIRLAEDRKKQGSRPRGGFVVLGLLSQLGDKRRLNALGGNAFVAQGVLKFY